MLSDDHRKQFESVRDNWGGAYVLEFRPRAPSPFRAIRRDQAGPPLSAATPGALREEIIADYERNPVLRTVAP